MIEPFDRPEMRAEFAERLERATGLRVAPDAKYPSVRLSDLGEDQKITAFLSVLDWLVEATRATG